MKKKTINCDFKISTFCKGAYSILPSSIKTNKQRNNGKYRCKFCAIESTHGGKNSHFYKGYHINHSFFETIDEEIKAYLLGVIAGDGSIKHNSIEVCANNKDIETLLLVQKYMAPDLKIKPKSSGNCSFIKIHSRQMAKDLSHQLNVSFGKKSNKITLPNISKNLIHHFIRGLMDTDGCIDNAFTSKKCPRCYYSSTSEKIINEIKELSNKLDIFPYKSGIKLYFVGKNAFKFLNFIYENSNFQLSRKKEFYDIWKTWKSREGTIINPSKIKKRKEEKWD